MGGIGDYMTDDHAQCDEHFALAEDAAQARDWEALSGKLDAFVDAMRRHFDLEESLLFPAFEARTGMTSGPTQMMRSEHEQMRELIDSLVQAAQARDTDAYAGFAETLLLMMQQHNIKEEQMLYPMMDEALGGEGEALLDRMQNTHAV